MEMLPTALCTRSDTVLCALPLMHYHYVRLYDTTKGVLVSTVLYSASSVHILSLCAVCADPSSR